MDVEAQEVSFGMSTETAFERVDVTKFVFITGGVASALGKGITAASLGRLLKARGLNVTLQKLDPYLNVDPGTMNPFEHGEVFVTEDGGETDLDLGHYERFVDVELSALSSVSSGQVWQHVIERERAGDYLGKTVQVVPHITDEIRRRVTLVADEDTDVVIVEVGGTVGDIEGLPFLEAVRQMRYDVGRENIVFVHCALVPYIAAAGELKTKPAQHSVRELRSAGIQPDVLVLRSDRHLDEDLKRKVALQCDVDFSNVICAADSPSVYDVPETMHREGLDDAVLHTLRVDAPEPDLSGWLPNRTPSRTVTVAVVGKYVELHDAYLSVNEALFHSGFHHDVNVDVRWVEASDVADDTSVLHGCDGVVVPGGFGPRGFEGKVAASRWARERDVPYLGLCLGFQAAVVDVARNLAGLEFAQSEEFADSDEHHVISLMADQKNVHVKGGTMRLGVYPAKLEEGTLTRRLYGEPVVYERHRHRFEVNNRYRDVLQQAGLTLSGLSPDGKLVEFIELPDRRWFVATQAHPEFKSRPNRPHPLFCGFVAAACDFSRGRP